jgi:hydrogenase small subunit
VVAVATGRAAEISLDDLQRPRTFSSSFTQTWRARNMRFAHEASATELGQRKGWLYYELGSRGPMTHSPCNRILWNRQSKTRAGMPHPGGTDPGSPFHDLAPVTVLTTHTVRGVPREVPSGIDKPGLIRLATAATASSPSWTEEDIFVV